MDSKRIPITYANEICLSDSEVVGLIGELTNIIKDDSNPYLRSLEYTLQKVMTL